MLTNTSKRIQTLKDSMIRTMTIEAHKHNAINMGQGFPEFEPPQEVILAAQEALLTAKNNQYSEDRGLKQLRDAISQKYKRFYNWEPDPETQITVLCGVTEAIMASIIATVEKDDKVIIVEPAHENYLAAVLFAGASPLYTELKSPEFKLNLNQIEEHCKNGAKHIILNTPHNPTGRVFNNDEITGLRELVKKYNLRVITDEIYEHIIYDNKTHKPFALEPDMKDFTITTSGIGKTYSLTGWRVGYVIAPAPITHLIRRVHTFLSICSPTPLQLATITALELPDDYYIDLIQKYQEARDFTINMLNKVGFKAKKIEGAYYVMADFSELSDLNDMEFAYALVQKAKVAVVPGTSFYHEAHSGKNLVRFAFPKPMSILEEVAKRLTKHF